MSSTNVTTTREWAMHDAREAALTADLIAANRARDKLFGETLVLALGAGIIDTVQMEKILRIFNERRPD